MMVLIIVEAVPAGSKPPGAVGVRIPTGERHGLSAPAPLSTRTLSLQGGAGGSVESSPKLVKLFEPSSTLVKKISLSCFA